MATSTLEVIIRGRDLLTPTVRQAQASLSGLGKTADGLKGSVLTGLGLGAGVAGFTLVTNAVGKAADVLADATRAAIEDEASIRKLTTTLQENVPAWNGSLDAVDRFIKKGQALAFTDDAIREAVGKLAVSTGDVTKAMDLTRLSMDLARLKGIDLATATDYINKALGGQVGALRRVLPFIDKNASSTEALAAITKAAAGQAESFAATTEGRLLTAQQQLDEAMEALGRTTMPALAEVAGALADQFRWVARGIDDINTALSTLGGLIPKSASDFDALGLALENMPLVGAWIKTNRLRDAQEEAASAAMDHYEAIVRAKDGLDGLTITTTTAAMSVRELAAAEKDAANQAVIAEWNARAVGDAYWNLAIRADLAAERTDMLRRVQKDAAYSAQVASTGAWTQATAYEALNKGLERAGLGANATDERMKTLTKSEGGKGAAAKGLTKDLKGETDAMNAATAAAKKLQAEIDASAKKGKPDVLGINGTGRVMRERRGGESRAGDAPAATTTTQPLYGTFPIGGGAAVVLPTTTPSVVNAPLSSPPVMAQGTAAPSGAYAFSFYLDGKAISDAVEVYLGRKSG